MGGRRFILELLVLVDFPSFGSGESRSGFQRVPTGTVLRREGSGAYLTGKLAGNARALTRESQGGVETEVAVHFTLADFPG
eukprot:11356787-Heterocapsa_arctica.AAC.1